MPDTPFARRLPEIKTERGTTVRAIAARAHYSKSYVQDLISGTRVPTIEVARELDAALEAGGELVALAALGSGNLPTDELDALELARRVDASASAYTTVPPDLTPTNSREISAASARFLRTINDRELRYRPDLILNSAVSAAVKRPCGDSWAWGVGNRPGA